MNLEHVLRNIKTDGERRHLESPESGSRSVRPGGGGVHTISLVQLRLCEATDPDGLFARRLPVVPTALVDFAARKHRAR